MKKNNNYYHKTLEEYYDDLSSHYHLIFEDWDEVIKRQSAQLAEIIFDKLGAGVWNILDPTCGIGTQALGLAKLGHVVTASDQSPLAIQRASLEAKKRNLKVELFVANLLELDQHIDQQFDVIVSGDNSLPHLLSDQDLERAFAQCFDRLRPGGMFIATLRNYDNVMVERYDHVPLVMHRKNGKRVVFQLWNWQNNSSIYEITLFIIRRLNNEWITRQFTSKYRAIKSDTLKRLMGNVEFTSVEWKPDSKRQGHAILVGFHP